MFRTKYKITLFNSANAFEFQHKMTEKIIEFSAAPDNFKSMSLERVKTLFKSLEKDIEKTEMAVMLAYQRLEMK